MTEVPKSVQDAKVFLRRTKSAIAEVAKQNTILFRSGEGVRFQYVNRPDIPFYSDATLRVFTRKIQSENQLFPDFNEVVVNTANSSENRDPSRNPSNIDKLMVTYRLPEEQNKTHFEVVTMSTTGNVGHNFRTLNGLAQNESLSEEQQVLDLNSRSRKGLVVARFATRVFQQLFDIGEVSLHSIEELDRELTAKTSGREFPLEPGIAVLLPSAV